MDFHKASSRATGASITLADIAEAAGVAPQTLRRARMDPESPNYRQPPDGWEKALARLAERRAKELQRLAAALRKSAKR
jgi:hypothetical protein